MLKHIDTQARIATVRRQREVANISIDCGQSVFCANFYVFDLQINTNYLFLWKIPFKLFKGYAFSTSHIHNDPVLWAKV